MGRRKGRGTPPATDTALPGPLRSTLEPLLGPELQLLEAALVQPPPVTIRLNPGKPFEPGGEAVPWCSTGRILAERPAFTFDPLLHAGAYYVQEAGSMFLEQAVRASGLMDQDILALDLCAAPGGKSTHLRSLLGPGSLLVSNEVDRRRQAALQENLWKWGAPNVMITGSAPEDLAALPEFFDLIVVDAPCSGEGMFRKDAFARAQWTPRLVEQCMLTQQHIVEHAWSALAPGGVLIYSTCTWEPGENEHQLLPLLGQGGISLEIPTEPAWGIRSSLHPDLHANRFYPHRTLGEGFFLAMLRKAGDKLPRERSAGAGDDLSPWPWLDNSHALCAMEHKGIQHMVGESWRVQARRIRHSLRTLAPGIPVAERKAGSWLPHPALALNQLLDPASVHMLELDHDQSIAYLKGQSLPAQAAQAEAIACHHGTPLGWVNGAGNRWNNRWPDAWRIRSHTASAAEVPWKTNPE
jgi:16S rRNA C967 or C1407 C5-methylase (RsmB/RsmF family)